MEEIIGVLFSILADELSSNEEVNPNQTLISSNESCVWFLLSVEIVRLSLSITATDTRAPTCPG